MGSISRPKLGRPAGTESQYEKIADDLRKKIFSRELPDGAALPSLLSLAARYKVGRQVVRLAIETLKNERLVVANLKRRIVVSFNPTKINLTSGIVLQIASSTLSELLRAPFFADMQRGILTGCGELKTPIHIVHDSTTRSGIPKRLLEMPIRGILVTHYYDSQFIEYLAKVSLPIVIADQPIETESVHSVSVDNMEPAYQATMKLISLGHTRIAFVRDSHVFNKRIDPDARERNFGFLKTCAAAGLGKNSICTVTVNYFTEPQSRSLDPIFCSKPHATGVVCSSDGSARLIEARAKLAGFTIPRDISLVGFQATAGAFPELSGPRTNFFELGRRAVNLLAYRKSPNIKERIPAIWHEGTTVAPPTR